MTTTRQATCEERIDDQLKRELEDAEQIIVDIVAGFTGIDELDVMAIKDRKAAIEFAIGSAEKDDIVLIAGKGHETYQIIGTTKYDFDDREIAREALEAKS